MEEKQVNIESIQESGPQISEKERIRREKIKKAWLERKEKKRREGYAKWLKERRKEIAKRKKKEAKEKEKERELKKKLREKEREKKLREKKNKPKKVGRPKKRGPKKKRKSRAKKKIKQRPVIDFKIIGFHNGKQCGYFGDFSTIEQAHEELGKLIEKDRDIKFPKKIENNAVLSNCRYEYLLLEKNRYGDKENIQQRNEYGKIIEHVLNTDKWVIIEKQPYNVEETFWVWGCNPNTERKTFDWIYNNKIINELGDDYSLKRVFLYKNKIIIKDDNENMEVVFCKTPSDSIRFYNLAEECIKNDKLHKRVYFMGSLGNVGERKKKIEKELMDLTGWTIEKVQQSYTKKHSKKAN